MERLGFIYLFVFCTDFLLSVIASFVVPLEMASNTLSCFMYLPTLGVFILACADRLHPRDVFLTLSGYYMAMITFGIIVGFALYARLGEGLATADVNLAFLRKTFSWYPVAHWVVLGLWGLTAGHGVWGYVRSRRETDAADPAGS